MSTQYDFPRTTNHPRTMDHAHLKLGSASNHSSRHPSHSSKASSRRVPVPSASMPTTSWLSDVGEFTTSPLSPQDYLSVSIPSTGSFLTSGSMSDSGSPSRLSPRARSRDFISPTSVSPQQASSSGSLSRHSPIPPARTLHTSRSFSSTSPLKTSAFSDRDASGHLDFKRLMSKPAKQSASASSMVSLPSDSERSVSASSSRFPASRRPSEPFIRSPPLKSNTTSPSREKAPLQVKTYGLPSSPRVAQGPSPERRPGTSDGQPSSSSSKPTSRNNVLRRRPSAHSNPNTPTAGHFQLPTDESYPPPRTTPSKPTSRPERHTASFSSRPTTSPASNRAATLPRKMSLSATSKSQHVPGGLTPAGAVALAYKQQEQRREELAETASFNDAYRPPRDPTALPMRPIDTDPPTDDAEEEGGEPYYTVFGSATGRLVAVGSPVDDDWNVGGWETRATVAAAHKPSGSRSLSRKVSGSFKRVAESMKRDRDVRDPVARTRGLEDWRPYDGSRSPGGRDSPPQQKTFRKPQPLDTQLEGRASPRASPVPKSGSPAGSPSPQEEGRGSRTSKSRGKEELSPGGSGGMWSKLMKRISTGGLREKYNQSDEPPPPVPALPQNISKTPTSRTTMEISHTENGEVSENGVLLKRFMQSRTSLSGVRPSGSSVKAPSSSSSRPSTGTAGRPSTGNTTKSRASLGQRPTTVTRSSSPVSSEVASSGFFNSSNRTPSNRSSFSSLGEELPPMPKNLGQYIVPPRELSRMTKTSDGSSATSTPSKRSRKSSRSQSAPVEDRAQFMSPADGSMPSLPIPPRRATHEGSSPHSASFSHSNNDPRDPPSLFQPLPMAEFGMKEPPPRPKRSSRRMPPPNVDVPPRSQSMSATMPRSPMTPRGPPAVRVDIDLARSPSTGALSYASTARQVSAASSTSPSSGASHSASPSSAASLKRSPLMFRELESPRQKLSEKEKAAKWEDLLERSARAGGTLHIGDSGLLSEHPDVEGASVQDFDEL
ncbi:hypothetical protein C8Q77DRAFT_222837 [Trametes polyzona]|nr:hypothetical protein C8Q77DRAFT_222837 [Trametes polyzona]